jgi:hypothetical protein
MSDDDDIVSTKLWDLSGGQTRSLRCGVHSGRDSAMCRRRDRSLEKPPLCKSIPLYLRHAELVSYILS